MNPDPKTHQRKSDPQVTAAARRVRLQTVTTSLSALMRQLFALIGVLLIAVAIPIAFLTPILPIGLPLAILGVILLGRNAIWGKRWMEGILARNPRLERFAPNWLMRLVFGREKI